jgi:hypothetical protein
MLSEFDKDFLFSCTMSPGCYTSYFVKRSSECPLISFDKDQPNIILIATITANLKRSSVLGSRIVVKMSAPTTKSSAISKPPTKRNRITSPFEPSPFRDLYKDLMYPINATTTDIPMIMAAAASIPVVTYSIITSKRGSNDSDDPSTAASISCSVDNLKHLLGTEVGVMH